MNSLIGERPSIFPTLFPYLLLTVVVLAVYANTLAGGFVWDDNLFSANQVYWQYDLRTIFLSLANGLEYQPVRDLSFLFDIALWGDRPFGFHLTNLLLFTAIVLLVYRIARELHALCSPVAAPESRALFVPLMTALFFAMHPTRSEVVAWITQRNTLLATLFCLTSLLLFFICLKHPEKRTLLWASLAAFLLALLSKATVIILPLLLLFLLLAREQNNRLAGSFRLSLIPFFLLAAAGALLHLIIARQTTVVSASIETGIIERLTVALQIPFFYLQKTVLPLDISALYTQSLATSPGSPKMIIPVLVLGLCATAAWLLRRSFPPLLTGFGWFIITLLPVSNLLATSPVVADRYLFLPAIGTSFLAASLLERAIPSKYPAWSSYAVALLLLLPLAFMTVNRNRVWQNDISLWSDTSNRSPSVTGVWYNLGRAWHRTSHLGLALEAYLRAITLDPGSIKSLDNAAALISSTEGSVAMRHALIRELSEQLPPYPAGLSLLGFTAVPWAHPEKSEELFLRLLTTDRDSVELHLALANLYLKSGAVQRAAEIYRVAAQAGIGKGVAEFGLARIAASEGAKGEAATLAAIARQKGGVPESLLKELEK